MFEQDLKCGLNQFHILNWCILETFYLGSLNKVNGNSPKATASETVFCVFVLEGLLHSDFATWAFHPS